METSKQWRSYGQNHGRASPKKTNTFCSQSDHFVNNLSLIFFVSFVTDQQYIHTIIQHYKISYIKRFYQKELDRRWSPWGLDILDSSLGGLPHCALLHVGMLQLIKFSTHSVNKPIHHPYHQIDQLWTRNLGKKDTNLYGEIGEEDGLDCIAGRWPRRRLLDLRPAGAMSLFGEPAGCPDTQAASGASPTPLVARFPLP
jgi:hypothetical protein